MEDTLLLGGDHAIIVPPIINTKDIPTRKTKFIIDSRDRNTNIYKLPSKYTIKPDEPITDVTNVELILTDFRFNNYNVTKYSNILHTSGGNFTIQEGKYDGQSLATELTSLSSTLAVTYNDITEKLTITSSSDITLQFKSPQQRQYDIDVMIDTYMLNSIGRVLGFPIHDYDLLAGVDFEVPNRIDLETENYIVMYMQQAKVYQSKNNNIHNCFAIINKLENSSNGLVMFNNSVSKSFNPPIANLNNLMFKFCDYNGNLYDFQNKEHRFELIFTSLKQTRCYNQIFS
jgi:hypothetical protein